MRRLQVSRPVQGFVADGYQRLAEAFEGILVDGLDDGASLALYRNGQAVLDVWGGGAWEKGSAGNILSVTKAATAIMVLQLAERGQLALDAPVARYWPEFASSSKAAITLTDVLQHREALPFLDGPLQAFFDAGEAERIIAAQAPAYPVGSVFNYHPLTYGTILGEVIRRVTGITAGEYFARHIAAPLGLEFWIGLPEAEESRHVPNTWEPLDLPEAPSGELSAEYAASVRADAQLFGLFAAEWRNAPVNERPIRAVAQPAASGVATARAVARMFAATLGEVSGTRLLSVQTVTEAATWGTADIREPLPPGQSEPVTPYWGLGFQLFGSSDWIMTPGAFGHAGIGGRVGFADPASGVALGYVGQRMNFGFDGEPDPRQQRLRQALHELL